MYENIKCSFLCVNDSSDVAICPLDPQYNIPTEGKSADKFYIHLFLVFVVKGVTNPLQSDTFGLSYRSHGQCIIKIILRSFGSRVIVELGGRS